MCMPWYVHGLYATKVKYSHVIYLKDASMKEGARSWARCDSIYKVNRLQMLFKAEGNILPDTNLACCKYIQSVFWALKLWAHWLQNCSMLLKNDWVCSGMCMVDSRKAGILSLCMQQRAVIGKLCLTSESQMGFPFALINSSLSSYVLHLNLQRHRAYFQVTIKQNG